MDEYAEELEIRGVSGFYEPTAHLKFVGGVLHQLWEATLEFPEGTSYTQRDWRKVESE